MADGTLAVYLTLEDIIGSDRLAEGADFCHSCQAGRPGGTDETSYRYQSLGYHGESGTYGFLVTITPANEDKSGASKAVLLVKYSVDADSSDIIQY
ncbi:hypothetical protein [Acetatifactor aquisgranensis]|uniref:hypothetical protein n=1 Tax=Acetatifactor aquisgranensis TaxID=2941233 RepID=UPI00203ED4C2|nr:hypothetical protein [Acetatifactor aquisgranensis]